MAKIKGTDGNDTLVGTADDDTIATLLGKDTVDGRGGYDVLAIDWSSVTVADVPSGITLGGNGEWTGTFFSGPAGARNSVSLKNVERIVYSGQQADEAMSVVLGTLAIDKSRLSLDGGAGQDLLAIDAAQTDAATRLTLAVAADGKISGNVGVLAGWERFDITLGQAQGNTLTLGAGNDTAHSTGGGDTIDMGGGTDGWVGNYAGRSDALALSYSVADGVSIGTGGGAALARVTNVESINAFLGSGADSVDVSSGVGLIDGGTGDNTLTVHAGGAQPRTVYVYVENLGLRGQFIDAGASGALAWKNFRSVTVAGSTADDQFTLSAANTVINSQNYAYSFDGGAGTDSFLLDLRAQLQTYISSPIAGSASVTFKFQNNTVALANFETVVVEFGANDDTAEAGFALHTVIDGGAGLDTISFVRASSAISVSLSNQGKQTVGPGAQDYQLFGVEGVTGSAFDDRITDSADANVIRGGDGNDTVLSVAASTAGADVFDGGVGLRDRIDYQLAGGSVIVSLANTAAQSTGGGGIDTLTGFEDLGGSSYADTLTGNAGANRLYGSYGDDVLDGLAGDDILDGGAGLDTASFAGAGVGVTVSLATAASQNTGVGQDTLSGFENLTGSAYDDTLTGSSGANVITGGFGTDIMTGNGGADRFVFRSAGETSTEFLESDLITDFVGSSRIPGDVIDVSRIDANTATLRTNEAFTFIGTAAFTGAAGQLRAELLGDGLFYVSGDTNGDRTADFGIYVQSADSAIVKGDFVL